jgi:hypothetical protein
MKLTYFYTCFIKYNQKITFWLAIGKRTVYIFKIIYVYTRQKKIKGIKFYNSFFNIKENICKLSRIKGIRMYVAVKGNGFISLSANISMYCEHNDM